MKILISAGHTNNPKDDRGAAGNGYVEGVETVKVRDAVAALLRDRGLNVIEDGADGVNDPLKKALALARTAETAVEFHFNAGPPLATGTEVLAKADKRKLAQAIAKEIGAALDIPVRGGDQGWKSDKSGQHHRLAFCEAGGLIVELCFISSARDMKSYADNFGKLCFGIANALAGRKADAEGTYYTVRPGDNLTRIAEKYGTTVAALYALNPDIVPGGILSVGVQVRIR